MIGRRQMTLSIYRQIVRVSLDRLATRDARDNWRLIEEGVAPWGWVEDHDRSCGDARVRHLAAAGSWGTLRWEGGTPHRHIVFVADGLLRRTTVPEGAQPLWSQLEDLPQLYLAGLR
jgi:hypothetical protein